MAELPAYAVDGGRVPASMLRRALWASTGSANGVVGVNDLRVSALPTPGAAVRIRAGGALCAMRTTGINSQETYLLAMDSLATLPVSGWTGTRYLIARIDDWHFTGNPAPPDPLNAVYWGFQIVTTLDGITYPHVPLARIRIPSGASAITNDMLLDLREVANPRTKTEWRVLNLLVGDEHRLTNQNGYPVGQTWPQAATDAWGPIDIPEWATRAKIAMTWAGVRVPPGNVTGHTWVQCGLTSNPDNFVTRAVAYDTLGLTQHSTMTLISADERPIPAALRGTSQRFYPRGSVTGVHQGDAPQLICTSTTAMLLQVEFMERAD